MKNLFIIPALLISLSGYIFAQDVSEEVQEISTVDALLALVKEGKTQEQAANTSRENNFLANKTTKIVSKNLYINLLNVDDIVKGLITITKKNTKPGQYVLKNSNDLRIFELIKIFNKSSSNKIKVKWLSNKIIKNKIIKYDQLKPWAPKKSGVKDIINYIKKK